MQAMVHINFSSIAKAHFFYDDGKGDLGGKACSTFEPVSAELCRFWFLFAF